MTLKKSLHDQNVWLKWDLNMCEPFSNDTVPKMAKIKMNNSANYHLVKTTKLELEAFQN